MYFHLLLEEWNKICASRRDTPTNHRYAFLNALFSPENASKFLGFRSSLGDADSVQMLDLLIRNSLASYMGAPQSGYCFYSPAQWAQFTEQAKSVDCVSDSYLLDIIETFVLEGYNYKGQICVKTDDVVLDCGAYTGNTALYFSRKAGPKGHVHSFEPGGETFRQLKANTTRMNMGNVSTYNYALADKVGEVCFQHDGSPGARIVSDGGMMVPSTTIDGFVEEHNMDKVDFIKMDVEGAELAALRGSVKTCRRFKPQLAICVYHKPDDLITIPAVIREILPGYRFYLRHNSNNFWETVLFAAHSDKPYESPDDTHESAMLASWWKGVQALWNEKLLMVRKHNMEMYSALLSGMRQMPARPIFARGFEFVFYPLSPDQKLHYEFFDVGSGIEISLHFEGQYADRRDLMEEICSLSELEQPLRLNSGPWKGVSYLLTDNGNHQLAAKLMSYLVDISLPILKRSRLLANEVFFSIS